MIKILNGNSLEELKKFPDNYFHSVVTDPPYGLSFMGKKWDYNVPSVELWQEVLRVLKEGGYLLSFSGTRTQHRMAVNIEDAGFEIRDMIAWVYGSGFPKSHNIGKAVDKLQGNEREITGSEQKPKPTYHSQNVGGIIKEIDNIEITKGTSEWEGWGTALKPALEPITMARKPFKTTVAENVLKNGVGGINIDGCRVETQEKQYFNTSKDIIKSSDIITVPNQIKRGGGHKQGRFPANFIHNGSDEVTDLFPDTNPSKKAVRGLQHSGRHGGLSDLGKNIKKGTNTERGHNDNGGSASRFFYCAKASKQDRNEGLEDFEEKISGHKGNFRCKLCGYQKSSGSPCKCENPVWEEIPLKPQQNNHPTVKPTDLMRYLVRLVTPKEGIVLDCFMGSGSTGKACDLEGFNFVGIDLDKDYCEIAKARIDKAIEDKRIMESQMKLF